MRKLLLLLLGCILLVSGCASTDCDCIDYSDPNNWVICTNKAPRSEQTCDVFYIYPTLNDSKEVALFDLSDTELVEKTRNFVNAQAGIFADNARVFAPFVRQLEYNRCVDCVKSGIDMEGTQLLQAVLDTQDAFEYYMRYYNQGRPFVLVGHSQGAMDLYSLMKDRHDISVERGFVGAYLVGLPAVYTKNYKRDFAGRKIAPATGADDLGAFMVWNTQNSEATNPIFTLPHGVCINPLNWCTDDTPADALENIGEICYDAETGETTLVENFCGAVVDPEKGALIVDLPSDSEYDAYGFIGMGVFHMNDVWFFAENMCANMSVRAEKWHKQFVMRNS